MTGGNTFNTNYAAKRFSDPTDQINIDGINYNLGQTNLTDAVKVIKQTARVIETMSQDHIITSAGEVAIVTDDANTPLTIHITSPAEPQQVTTSKINFTQAHAQQDVIDSNPNRHLGDIDWIKINSALEPNQPHCINFNAANTLNWRVVNASGTSFANGTQSQSFTVSATEQYFIEISAPQQTNQATEYSLQINQILTSEDNDNCNNNDENTKSFGVIKSFLEPTNIETVFNWFSLTVFKNKYHWPTEKINFKAPAAGTYRFNICPSALTKLESFTSTKVSYIFDITKNGETPSNQFENNCNMIKQLNSGEEVNIHIATDNVLEIGANEKPYQLIQQIHWKQL